MPAAPHPELPLDHPDRVYTLPGLAHATGEPLRRLRNAVLRGELRARRTGRRWAAVCWGDYVAWRDRQIIGPETPRADAAAWARSRAAGDAAMG
jgi:hypothetical protein